jgi:hypothetical protein
MEDDTQVVLFRYYADELSFRSEEFVGLTVEQARTRHHQRDVGYLQS